MQNSFLEHINITVQDPQETAQQLCQLLDWHIRWQGESMDQGYTIHVGNLAPGQASDLPAHPSSYLALYSKPDLRDTNGRDHSDVANLNHFAVVVENLEPLKERALSMGMTPFNFGTYHPGERFYLLLSDGIELELVSYSQ